MSDRRWDTPDRKRAEVAKQELRKRTLLFDLDADALPDDDVSLTGFVPDAVYVDMLGDDFLDPVGPSQFVEKLRRAGGHQALRAGAQSHADRERLARRGIARSSTPKTCAEPDFEPAAEARALLTAATASGTGP